MSDNMDFDANLDDILAEFKSFGLDAPSPAAQEREIPVKKEAVPAAAVPTGAPSRVPMADPMDIDLSIPQVPASPLHLTPARRKAAAAPLRTPAHSPTGHFSGDKFDEIFAGSGKKSPAPKKTAPRAGGTPKKRRDTGSRETAPARTAERRERPPVQQPQAPTPPKAKGPAGILVTVLNLLIGLVVLCLVAVFIHPASNAASNAASWSKQDLLSKLDVYMNNASSDALGDLAYIKKIYKLDENTTVAPKPDQSKYGTVAIKDAAQILDVIQKARDSGLLEDQEVIFKPDVNFVRGSDIQYYCDDTILVICWKELIDDNVCSCVEIKIADPSQFRRKLADDTYASINQYYATTMYNQTNAVVAMNADYYMKRNMGIVAYQRQLYRYSSANYSGIYSMYNCLDNCFVTAKGDFLFLHKGETLTEDEVRQFIADNDVLFTIAFGPILVEDGVVQVCDWYPAGEPNTGYSRAGIGIFDELHYLYMSLNHADGKPARWTVNKFAQHIAEKGVYDAYALDGGQTGEVVFQGVPYNHIDFGYERMVSDIIYFATAIPEEEVTQ